jgi:Uma2 family endonuclease
MSIAPAKVGRLRLGPRSAGLLLTPAEFDRATGARGWRYELINGVLIVSPTPSRQERDPNEELGHWLRQYRAAHPRGSSLDATFPEEELETRQGQDRRRVDRAIWAGLGRDPEEGEVPTIAVEFVSAGKVNQERDYVAKRAEFREIGVRQYWVIDRFRRTLTVYDFRGQQDEQTVIPEGKTYETPLLPGFVLDLKRLLALADRWAKKKKSEGRTRKGR